MALPPVANPVIEVSPVNSETGAWECGFCERGQCGRCSHPDCTCCNGNPDARPI